MKVAFYLPNRRFSEIKLNKPEFGNPGIGGSEFMIWQVSYFLSKFYSNLEITVFMDSLQEISPQIHSIEVIDIEDTIKKANKQEIDYLILKTPDDIKIFDLLDEVNQKTIIWAHNFTSVKLLEKIANCKSVIKYICVSKQQYLMLIDHNIFNKSFYIYNAINLDNYPIRDNVQENNIICFVGSITPAKGFHVLAKQWPKIKKKIPDAKLYVIGSGNLYDRNQRLGKFSIAESNYEKTFINYLTDRNGAISSDVKFFGVLDNNLKIEVMNKAKVGVVNPTARGETFCISAIEFEAFDIPVVSRKKNGLLDTVVNGKTGILSSNYSSFSNSIVNILKNSTYNFSGREFVEGKFEIEIIASQWYELLNNINFCKNEYKTSDVINTSNLIIFRLINSNIKKILNLNFLPSIIEYRSYLRKLFKK